jgi:L-lactate dehydrogenase complex protein LldG
MLNPMLNSREKILKKISKSLENTAVPMPFPEVVGKEKTIFPSSDGIDVTEHFGLEFTKLGGKFLYCADEKEMVSQLVELADSKGWKNVWSNETKFTHLFLEHDVQCIRTGPDFEQMDASVTSCEAAVARLEEY